MARKELKASDIKSKEMREIVKALIEQGFTVTRGTTGHVLVHKDGKFVTAFAGTASDYRSVRNSLSPAKRAGFIWR